MARAALNFHHSRGHKPRRRGLWEWFADRCKEAKVPGRAHGLRKAGATIAAENGATTKQLMAIFGWSTLKMPELYARAADQKRLAESAMHLIESR